MAELLLAFSQICAIHNTTSMQSYNALEVQQLQKQCVLKLTDCYYNGDRNIIKCLEKK